MIQSDQRLVAPSGHRQRLRQRFLAGDRETRDEGQLLELLLTFALPQQDVRPLAEQLLSRFGSLGGVLAARAEDLLAMHGVKEQTLTLLKAVAEIAQRTHDTGPASAPPVAAPPAALGAIVQSIFTVGPVGGVAPQPGDVSSGAMTDAANGTDVGAPRRAATFPDAATSDAVVAVSPEPPAAPTEKPSAPRRAKQSTALDAEQTPPGIQPVAPARLAIMENAGFRDALAILPEVPLGITSRVAMRTFLREHLGLNSSESRQRMAEYLTRRLFPAGEPDTELIRLAHAFPGEPILRDAIYGRYCIAEPLLPLVMREVILPAMANGKVTRERVRLALRRYYPESRSIDRTLTALAQIWTKSGVLRPLNDGFDLIWRDIPPATFAFILHDLFPIPGIYEIAEIADHPVFRSLLWSPARLMPTLYLLRERGWISQIVEFDRLRQITTRYTRTAMTELLTGAADRR